MYLVQYHGTYLHFWPSHLKPLCVFPCNVFTVTICWLSAQMMLSIFTI